MLKTETNEQYHAAPGVSKTRLWELYNKTPFHARYGAPKESHSFDIGAAAHIAILEPELVESSVLKGTIDRRGNKWQAVLDEAEATNKIPLTESEYEMMLLLRDVSDTVPELQVMRRGNPIIERSAYYEDESGITLRTRPDIYNPDLCLMADIKCMADASPLAFSKTLGAYGYHVQDALYSDVWEKAGGGQVDAFFFIVFEKSNPPCVAVYELDAPAKAEGYAIYRQSVERWAECERNNDWPAYGKGIQPISLKKWDYKETEAE